MKSSIYDELNREKAKLNHLVNEAMKNGIPVSENKEILEQSRKVDTIIMEIQKTEENEKVIASAVAIFIFYRMDCEYVFIYRVLYGLCTNPFR